MKCTVYVINFKLFSYQELMSIRLRKNSNQIEYFYSFVSLTFDQNNLRVMFTVHFKLTVLFNYLKVFK